MSVMMEDVKPLSSTAGVSEAAFTSSCLDCQSGKGTGRQKGAVTKESREEQETPGSVLTAQCIAQTQD